MAVSLLLGPYAHNRHDSHYDRYLIIIILFSNLELWPKHQRLSILHNLRPYSPLKQQARRLRQGYRRYGCCEED